MSLHDDAVRDGLALIEALHRHDLEAVRCLLDNADLRVVAVFLARVADDLVGDLAEWWNTPAGDLLSRLRTYHAEN